jgi:DNA-binding ferritin-like protein (Dps family)
VQAVLDLLANEETRKEVVAATQIVGDALTTFVALLVQDQDKDKKADHGITITDTQCRP